MTELRSSDGRLARTKDPSRGADYSVQPIEGFTFVAFAVHPDAEALFEHLQTEPNPTTQWWRWVPRRRSGQIENVGFGGLNLADAELVGGRCDRAGGDVRA